MGGLEADAGRRRRNGADGGERGYESRRGLSAKADSDHVRRQNRSLVLTALRRRTRIARVDLGAETHLSPATITAITADLIAEGLVAAVSDEEAGAESGEVHARRGRPRVLLRLDAEAGYVLAVRVSFNSLVMELVDYAGQVIGRHEPEILTLEETREGFPRRLAGEIRDFVGRLGLDLGQIAEIAIGAQGIVDTVAGSVMWSPAFRVRDVSLVEPLTAALGRPCTIFNDANMIAQALHEANPDVYSGTFAVIFVDHGVGAGLFIGNRLHHGAAGSAAEFGHMNHMPGGALCRCGRRGCIEAYSADYAIYRDANGFPPEALSDDMFISLAEMKALEERALAGDARARASFAKAGQALGYGAARLIALINPARIIFTGGAMRAYPLFEVSIKAAIGEALVEDLRRHTVIETLPWDSDMIMEGLKAYMLARLDREVFANPAEARRYRPDAASA